MYKSNDKNQCISPFVKKGENIPHPCGRCVNCKKRYVSSWSYRLTQHLKVSESAWFITYTYNTDTVPITNKGRMSLDKKDFQDYMKRLRKAHKKSKIKYYAVGEYGGEKYRPHYHVIMFNADLSKVLTPEDAIMALNNPQMLDGKTEFKCPMWGKGHITIGTVSEASIGYVLKYITKPERIPQFNGDDREPEFSLKSKYLGINYFSTGQKIKCYKISISSKIRKKGNLRNTILLRPSYEFIMKPEVKKWHKQDLYNRAYAPLPDGKKVSLPRYYKEKIYTQIERQKIAEHITKQIHDENLTKDEKTIQKEMQSLQAFRHALATTLHKDTRNLSNL